jgi:hypothetical protein
MPVTRRLLITNITGTGYVSEPFEPMDAGTFAVYVGSRAGVTSGAVQLEEAPSKDAPNAAWIALGTAITVPAALATAVVRPFGVSPAVVGAIRARVSTTIVGGVIDVTLVAG